MAVKWLKDPVSQRAWDDPHVIDALLGLHEDDPTLGYRFLTDKLGGVGISASENRVWRLCSTAGIFASHARRKAKAGKPAPPVHDDLLAVLDGEGRVTYDFRVSRPNEKWLTDITEHRTAEGKRAQRSVGDHRTVDVLRGRPHSEGGFGVLVHRIAKLRTAEDALDGEPTLPDVHPQQVYVSHRSLSEPVQLRTGADPIHDDSSDNADP